MHGGLFVVHDISLLRILPLQQLLLPPSRESQPVPPHVPQEIEQHALLLTSRIPVMQDGSPSATRSVGSIDVSIHVSFI